MSEKVIKLSRMYDAHELTFDEVTLRAPKLRDYMAIGDPVEVHAGPDGDGRFIVEHLDRVASYLDRLAVSQKPGRECLDDLDLVDSIKVKEAIGDFFMEARKQRAAPTS